MSCFESTAARAAANEVTESEATAIEAITVMVMSGDAQASGVADTSTPSSSA